MVCANETLGYVAGILYKLVYRCGLIYLQPLSLAMVAKVTLYTHRGGGKEWLHNHYTSQLVSAIESARIWVIPPVSRVLPVNYIPQTV